MFFARQDPPDPARATLRALRPSLNTPVLAVEDLPSGPASAAIAFLGGRGGTEVHVAIRSERSGEVVFFGPEAGDPKLPGSEIALDAALSFAESMGFLFEEDCLPDDPAAAQGLWRSLLEAAARGPRSRLVAPPALVEDEDHWLEDVAAPIAPVGRSVALTKFRRGAPLPARAGRQPLAGSGGPMRRVP